jgi:hypothetical protein
MKKEPFPSSSSSSSSFGRLHFHDGILYSTRARACVYGIYIGMRFFFFFSVCVLTFLIDRGDMNIQVILFFSLSAGVRRIQKEFAIKEEEERKKKSLV